MGEEREERLGWDFGVWTGVGTEGGLMLRLFDKDVKFVEPDVAITGGVCFIGSLTGDYFLAGGGPNPNIYQSA